MRRRPLHRSSGLILPFLVSLLFHTASGRASQAAQTSSAEPTPERAAIRRLLRLGERAESLGGGDIALAQRRADTSDAKTTSAWLDWLPDFSVAVRRQLEQETDTELNVPRWRVDIEGQLALSMPKARAIAVANAARDKARAELQQATHAARTRTLEAGLKLHFLERRAALLRDQIDAFSSLASEVQRAAGGTLTDERVLLEGYSGELRGTLAGIESEQREAAQRLAARLETALTDSGLDPRLDLPSLLAAVQAETAGSKAQLARIQRADIELEKQRLAWTESQSWYVPELRATTLATLPQGSGSPEDGVRGTTSVTSELALGLRVRPGVPALQAAQQHAIAKSRFDEEHSRWLRAQTEDRARARVEELSRAWGGDGGVRVAKAEFDDVMRRFARARSSVCALSQRECSSSKRLLAMACC